MTLATLKPAMGLRVLAIPVAADPPQIDLALAVDEQVPLALSHHGLDLDTPRDDVVRLEAHDSIVVRLRRVLAGHTQPLSASLVGVGDLGNTANHHLGRELEASLSSRWRGLSRWCRPWFPVSKRAR
jgi:hypothetical protein